MLSGGYTKETLWLTLWAKRRGWPLPRLARVYELATATPVTVPATGDVVHHATPRDTLDVRLASAEGELTGARQLIKFLEVNGLR